MSRPKKKAVSGGDELMRVHYRKEEVGGHVATSKIKYSWRFVIKSGKTGATKEHNIILKASKNFSKLEVTMNGHAIASKLIKEVRIQPNVNFSYAGHRFYLKIALGMHLVGQSGAKVPGAVIQCDGIAWRDWPIYAVLPESISTLVLNRNALALGKRTEGGSRLGSYKVHWRFAFASLKDIKKQSRHDLVLTVSRMTKKVVMTLDGVKVLEKSGKLALNIMVNHNFNITTRGISAEGEDHFCFLKVTDTAPKTHAAKGLFSELCIDHVKFVDLPNSAEELQEMRDNSRRGYKYTPQNYGSNFTGQARLLEDKLVTFYNVHNPKMLREVRRVAKDYLRHQELMNERLLDTYGANLHTMFAMMKSTTKTNMPPKPPPANASAQDLADWDPGFDSDDADEVEPRPAAQGKRNKRASFDPYAGAQATAKVTSDLADFDPFGDEDEGAGATDGFDNFGSEAAAPAESDAFDPFGDASPAPAAAGASAEDDLFGGVTPSQFSESDALGDVFAAPAIGGRRQSQQAIGEVMRQQAKKPAPKGLDLNALYATSVVGQVSRARKNSPPMASGAFAFPMGAGGRGRGRGRGTSRASTDSFDPFLALN